MILHMAVAAMIQIGYLLGPISKKDEGCRQGTKQWKRAVPPMAG